MSQPKTQAVTMNNFPVSLFRAIKAKAKKRGWNLKEVYPEVFRFWLRELNTYEQQQESRAAERAKDTREAS